MSVQITGTTGNQNFDTFDTLNIYSKKGDGAAGMSATFNSLMTGNGDEPDSAYGLLARGVRYSERPADLPLSAAPRGALFRRLQLTAADVAFSLNVLKEKAHPIYSQLLLDMESATAEGGRRPARALRRASQPRRASDRRGDAGLFGGVVEGARFRCGDAGGAAGSGPYKVKTFEQGRFIEFERNADYWGKDLPVNLGHNNFQRLRFEYYRERQVAFEAFKAGAINYHREYTSRIWATGYDFPAVADGRIVKETLHNGAPTPVQGWYLNTRREQFKDPRVREAIGYAFDFEWTNKNVMFSSYKRVSSYFQNSPMAAEGLPGEDELKLLEPWRGKIPDSVFGEPYVPPVSDGSGSDRALLKKANELLLSAGCTRDGGVLKLPNGQPLTMEFLEASEIFQPHVTPFQQNLRKLGIEARSRIVDPTQYKSRTDSFDFDVASLALGGSTTPGSELRQLYSSASANMVGSRNLSGISDPAVDALVEIIANAKSRAELNTACRALDRILRSGHYWVAGWYNDAFWVAYWNAFSRPERQPKLGVGAPDTWWWDEEKAKKIGL